MKDILKFISDCTGLITQLSSGQNRDVYQELELNRYFINNTIATLQRAYISNQCKLISETNLYKVERTKLFPEYRGRDGVKSNDIADALLDERFAKTIKDLQDKEEELKLMNADIEMVDRQARGIEKQCKYWSSYFFMENQGAKRTA